MMTRPGFLRHGRPPAPTDDAGFTLVELLAAMAIFSILMALVSAALLSGMTSVSHLAQRSEQQASDRVVSETISRILRYAVGPERARAAFESVSATSLVFYSASGFAGSNDRPNRIEVRFDPATDLVVLTVTPPMLNPDADSSIASADSWTWPSAGANSRVLMRSTNGQSPIAFSVRLRCFKTTPACPVRAPGTVITTALLPANALDEFENEYVESVVLSVGDPDYPDNLVTQQVRMQNLYRVSGV